MSFSLSRCVQNAGRHATCGRHQANASTGHVRLHRAGHRLDELRLIGRRQDLELSIPTRDLRQNLHVHWDGLQVFLAVAGRSTAAPAPDRHDCRSSRTRVGWSLRSKRLVGDKRLYIEKLEDLQNLPLLTYTSPFHVLREAKWFQPILASAAIALETNSTHALLASAEAGAGVAVLPRFVARACEDLIPVSDDVSAQDLLLITHPEFRRDPKVRATAEFLKGLARDPDALLKVPMR
jgi:DNA-binding transcriptional LysR family regulator